MLSTDLNEERALQRRSFHIASDSGDASKNIFGRTACQITFSLGTGSIVRFGEPPQRTNDAKPGDGTPVGCANDEAFSGGGSWRLRLSPSNRL